MLRGGNSTKLEGVRFATRKTPQKPSEPTSPEAFVAKGRVTDAAGQILEGVEIVIDNTVFYNSSVSGSTDASGTYRVEIYNGSWRAYAKLSAAGGEFPLSWTSPASSAVGGQPTPVAHTARLSCRRADCTECSLIHEEEEPR